MQNANDDIDRLILSLRQDDLNGPADRLHEMLHRTAWTTGSELRGELSRTIRDIRKEHHRMFSRRTRQVLRNCLGAVDQSGPRSFWLSLATLFRSDEKR